MHHYQKALRIVQIYVHVNVYIIIVHTGKNSFGGKIKDGILFISVPFGLLDSNTKWQYNDK